MLEVCVIIPVLNGGELLRQQLSSLVAQVSPPDWELIVVDNGSTDASHAIVHSFSERLPVRLVTFTIRGQSHARNHGASLSQAPALIFLDQDDVTSPHYLRQMVQALAQHRFVAAQVDVDLLNRGWVRASREPAHGRALAQDFLPWAYGGTLGVSRALFEELEGFRQLGSSGEDVDFCWRAQQAGEALHLVSGAVLHYRFHEAGMAALFRQGRAYGRGGAAVYLEHRAKGAMRPSRRFVVRQMLSALTRMVLPGRGRRASGAFRAGRAWGLLTPPPSQQKT